jgi:hypothetical protein
VLDSTSSGIIISKLRDSHFPLANVIIKVARRRRSNCSWTGLATIVTKTLVCKKILCLVLVVLEPLEITSTMDSSPATSQKRKEIEPDDTDPSLNKRPRVEPTESPSASASTSSSAPAAQPQSLATWLKVPPPPPLSSSLTSSNPIFDKDSIFIAYVLPITEKEASFKHIAGLIERLEHTHHKLPDVIAGRSKRGTGQTDGVAVPIKKKGIKPSHNMWAARVSRGVLFDLARKRADERC